jgi:hypothetical protein
MQLGQPNTAIKYSRAPIGNSIRIGWGNCFIVKKVIDHYSVAVRGLVVELNYSTESVWWFNRVAMIQPSRNKNKLLDRVESVTDVIQPSVLDKV